MILDDWQCCVINVKLKLKNKVDVISLPFCRTADIHPKTCEILEKPSLVDLAWAGNSGIKETFDLSKVDYATFSFSKCFGVHKLISGF